MLYSKNWQGCPKGFHSLIGLFPLLAVILMTSCLGGEHHKNRDITMAAFSDLKTPAFVLDAASIKRQLCEIASKDTPQTAADRAVRDYYSENSEHLLWIDRLGVDSRPDTLLSWLHQVGQMGLSERAFYVAPIEALLQRLRQMDFQPSSDINRVAAQLEYHLSKACLRYVYGQRFGFINPNRIFNHLDMDDSTDTIRHIVRYRGLFDMDMDLPSATYAHQVMRTICNDSLAILLHEIQPQDKFYQQLQRMLSTASDDASRRRILCNMERCRWRLHHPIPEEGKRVVVNVPAYSLYAYGADSILHMRVACGATKTKTPLLTSEVEWMEVNPQWVIPKSILEKDVVRHAGDSAYFARNKYNIYERATNKQMPIEEVTRSMLMSGKYRVAQQSGSHNSLGRIVFRFKNKFSVFLHYTSTPGVFQRDSRAVSHGCVRVARPYDLAHFLLDNPDEWLLDRIRISMGLKAETDRGRQYLKTHPTDEDHKLIGYVPVKPHVPLYIIYYTLWTDENGVLQSWPDVYGYDTVIWNHLQTFVN